MSVCLSRVRSHILKTTCPNFTKFSYVKCSCSSVLLSVLWRQCNMLCTFSCVDMTFHSHNGTNGAESNKHYVRWSSPDAGTGTTLLSTIALFIKVQSTITAKFGLLYVNLYVISHAMPSEVTDWLQHWSKSHVLRSILPCKCCTNSAIVVDLWQSSGVTATNGVWLYRVFMGRRLDGPSTH